MVVSWSKRIKRVLLKYSSKKISILSVPEPCKLKLEQLHSGHFLGTPYAESHLWQTSLSKSWWNTRRASQALHSAAHLQSLHSYNGEKPLLLIKIRTCLFLLRVFSIASRDSWAIPDSNLESLISRIIKPGGWEPFALFNIFICLNILSWTDFNVCSEGVAEPRIIGNFSTWALLILTSLAENLKPSCCLYDWSCSSSTMIKPRFC